MTTTAEPVETLHEIGDNAQIDPGVILGYRYRGASKPLVVASHAIIRSGSVLYANSRIGKQFTCGHNVVIRAECEIGNRVVILHQSTVEGRVSIADGVKIMAHVYLPSGTMVQRFVFIGPGTTFLNAKYPMRDHSGIGVTGAFVGEGACIGGNVTICPGVRIGSRSFVGAGSVVTRDVPEDMLAYGCPARVVPLPEALRGGNDLEQVLTGSDLWGGQDDSDWATDYESELRIEQ